MVYNSNITTMGKMNKNIKTEIVDTIPNIYYRLDPDKNCTRVTRSISRILEAWKNFMVIEVYKCMPLLGDEEKIPNWDVHVVRYAVVFDEN